MAQPAPGAGNEREPAPLGLPLRALRAFALLWERPLPAAVMATAVYAILARRHGCISCLSINAYFNYLADALLHGQTWLRLLPEHTLHDLSFVDGRWYLYWPPFPAVLLLPFVAIFGVHFSDIAFTLVLGGLNVALVALLLRAATARRVIRLGRLQRGILVLFFALGTVQVTLAPLGRVWFTAQIVGFACVALAYLAALRLDGPAAFLGTGAALGCAFLTRNHLLAAGLWPAVYLLVRARRARRSLPVAEALAGFLPIAAAFLVLGLYHQASFGDPFETGLHYHRMAGRFAADYARYGPFSLHYLPANVKYQLLAYPFPLGPASAEGGSLFLLSPVFFAALSGMAWGRPRWSAWTLAATILLVDVPILLLMGTGWMQFGPRYTFDFTVPLLLLTAIGLSRWPLALLLVLAAISILQYLIGARYLASLLP